MQPDPTLKLRLGLVIRRHRENRKFTQEEFADLAGLHTPYYGQIERGVQNVTLWSLQRVAAGLNLSVTRLLREAEKLDLAKARRQPPNPPRRGRPPGAKSRWR